MNCKFVYCILVYFIHYLFRFKPFGKLRYCRLTMDPETGRPRGTGFVCFWKREDADKCLAEAEKINQDLAKYTNNVGILRQFCMCLD
jgi:RNA recognition motif-containing protein